MNEMAWCTRCWVPSTRPRVTFNEKGVCNACAWADEKKTIDWSHRQEFFKNLVSKYDNVFVPWSGGKDSVYVAYKVREMGAKPILITVLPHLETEIGKWNRQHLCPDFEHVELTLPENRYRDQARHYLLKDGRPKHPWETAISAVVIRYALKEHGKALLVYGEEGEAEYGGVTRELDRWMLPVDRKYLLDYYYSENPLSDPAWELPEEEGFARIFMTQWSRFENWNPSEHANFAVAKGMRIEPVRNVGTFTQSSQLSDDLQDLHAYLMFLKFGFGRATSDACIGIRDGWIRRDEGLDWIETYDGEFPNHLIPKYLDYFRMTEDEFIRCLATHANKELMKHDNKWIWHLDTYWTKKRRKGSILENDGRFD